MRFLKSKRSSHSRRARIGFYILLVSASSWHWNAQAQNIGAPHEFDVGIIVTSSRPDAESVIKQLRAGFDFSVLAKEKSVDATAVDGGYMGKLDPNQLRADLRDALRGHVVGDLTEIVQVPAGFAVMKVLSVAPATEDEDPRKIATLVASGVIHYGPPVSGLAEADAAIQDYPKPASWNHDTQTSCEVRKASLSTAKSKIQGFLDSEQADSSSQAIVDRIDALAALAQLYGFSGEMEDSIKSWMATYELAKLHDPGFLPNIEESLGASYLHFSEMENGVYKDSRDLDIFPPLHPGVSFEKKEESKLAIEYLQKFLERQPNDLEVRWLLNVAYMTLGQYPAGVPAKYLVPEKEFHSKHRVGRFIDVAPAAGLNSFREAGGVIVDDFDNDGLLDVVVSSMEMCDPMRFFHNNGDGTFSDRTEQAGLLNQLGGLNIVQADYNNDGCLDLLVLRGGWEFPQPKSLLRNNCDGTFTDVTESSGLGVTATGTQSGAWADIDNDGYLDLFIGNERAPAQLFHNKGDGTFEEIGHLAGIDQTAVSKGVTASDYDHDGFVDFYVTNQSGDNYLYHNNGNNTFTDVARQAGVQAPTCSFATWFFDYDNDGWPDLFVDGYLTVVGESVKTYLGLPHNSQTLKLYRNKHDGTFEDVTAQVGLDKVLMPMGASFGDIDNDGYLDFYLGMGQPSFTALLPPALFRNNEGKSFVDVTESSGTGDLHKGHGVAFADLSRRGSEDIIAEIGGAVPADKHAMRVFENPGNDNDWLNVRLVGVKSNREAAGAEVHVTVQDGTRPPRSIYRTVGAMSSFGGNPLEQHIGLGHDAHTITVDVWWPASGTRQHFTALAKNQYLEIKEFGTSYTRLERKPFRLGKQTPAATSLAQGIGK
jgi:FG-GAP-like repeat/ASPIC and UnbV/PPIC-type PPIASE domain